MRYRAEREGNGIVFKINCPDCRITAWQMAESDALRDTELPPEEDLTGHLDNVAAGLTERLQSNGCTHPVEPDATARFLTELRKLFTDPGAPPTP